MSIPSCLLWRSWQQDARSRRVIERSIEGVITLTEVISVVLHRLLIARSIIVSASTAAWPWSCRKLKRHDYFKL